MGLIQTGSARVVVAFFCDRHRGSYPELEDTVARMSEDVWAYFNYRARGPETKH